MTDDPKPSNIVPFGKYKGRLIEEVLIDDPAYIEWLTAQDWFRTKFMVLHQVIINRGAEPEETPDHNAMQVRFLDDEFCIRFLRHLVPSYEAQVRSEFNKVRAANLQVVIEKIEIEKEAPRKADEELASDLRWAASHAARIDGLSADRRRSAEIAAEQYRSQRQADAHKERERKRDEHIKRMPQLDRLREMLLIPITTVNFRVERRFEVSGVDVVLTIMTGIQWNRGIEHNIYGLPRDSYWSWPQWENSAHWRVEFNIELKPTIGDDYPAVLRQMKRTDSNVLFVGAYTGKGATEEQFVATFRTAGIRVVFARDVGC
jgi:uncharacterized protein (DUF3820 family)